VAYIAWYCTEVMHISLVTSLLPSCFSFFSHLPLFNDDVSILRLRCTEREIIELIWSGWMWWKATESDLNTIIALRFPAKVQIVSFSIMSRPAGAYQALYPTVSFEGKGAWSWRWLRRLTISETVLPLPCQPGVVILS